MVSGKIDKNKKKAKKLETDINRYQKILDSNGDMAQVREVLSALADRVDIQKQRDFIQNLKLIVDSVDLKGQKDLTQIMEEMEVDYL